MVELNLFDLFYDLLNMLGRWSTNLYNWLFTPVESDLFSPLLKLLGVDGFVPFWAIGGAVVITLFVAWIVKQFVPLL